ncbi:MAG: hypothetical protein ACUVTE_01520 [Candidatus Bathycorpusculaceae bacterium]
MNKLELMEKFMNTFVGNGFKLIIKEQNNSFRIHTIEVMQKVDETCPVKEIPLGDYFLHLIATDQHGEEASLICNWSLELLQNLLESSKAAKEAGCSHVVMFRNPVGGQGDWLISWGNHEEPSKTAKVTYVI